MPVLGDAAVGDAVDIGGDEVHRLSLPVQLLEIAGEVPREAQVYDDAITGDDHLLDAAADIGDRGVEHPGRREWAIDALCAAHG